MTSSFPFEGTFLDFVDQADNEDAEENCHGGNDGNAVHEELPVAEYPGNEEDHFDVEEDEEHGRDVEFDGVAGARFSCWRHTAFVGRVLDAVLPAFLADKYAGQNDDRTDAGGEAYLNKDWYEVSGCHDILNTRFSRWNKSKALKELV